MSEDFPPNHKCKEYFDKLNQLLTDNGKGFNDPFIYEYDHRVVVFPHPIIKEWSHLQKKYNTLSVPKIIGEIAMHFQCLYKLGKEVSFKVQVGRYGRTDHMHVSHPSSKYVYRYILNLGQKEIYYFSDLPDDTVDETGNSVTTLPCGQKLHMKPSVRELEMGNQLVVNADNIVRIPYPVSNKRLFVSDRYKQKIVQSSHVEQRGFSRINRQPGTLFLRPNNYQRITLIFDVVMNTEGLFRALKIHRKKPLLPDQEEDSSSMEEKLKHLLLDEMKFDAEKEKYLQTCDEDGLPPNFNAKDSSCSSQTEKYTLRYKFGDKHIPVESFDDIEALANLESRIDDTFSTDKSETSNSKLRRNGVILDCSLINS